MTAKKFVFTLTAILILALILDLLLFYSISCTGDHIFAKGTDSTEYFEQRDTVRFADRLFSEYDVSQYPLLKEKLIAEKSSLGEYMTAWQYKNSGFDLKTYYAASVYSNGNEKDWTESVLDRYDLSYEQAEKRSEQLGYCISRLENAMSYPDYAKYVFRSSEELLSVSLLDTDSFAAKNAVKTKHDFYGLDAIRPTAESDIGVLSLFSDGYADIIAVICAFVSAVTAALYIKTQSFFGSRRLILTGCAAAAAEALIYISNAVLMNGYSGLGNMLRPIQSVEAFRTSSMMMNILTLISLRILFKLMLCSVIYFITAKMILSKRKIFCLALLAALILPPVFFPAGIFNPFRTENIFGSYRNLDILGNAVSPQLIFIPAMIILLFVSAVSAIRSGTGAALSAREAAEHEYYDEISRKYEETRKIRHDINNHLSALGILIGEGKTEEATAYLGEITRELQLQRSPAASGRPVLDALLLSKSRTAQQENIRLNISLGAKLPESISDYDLCGIFGNILDNAIEACRGCDGESFIKLSVRDQLDMLCIFCENPFSGAVGTDLGTTKPDKSAHGFGIKRIGQLAKKYDGCVNISAENHIFSISVLLQK